MLWRLAILSAAKLGHLGDPWGFLFGVLQGDMTFTLRTDPR